MRDRLHLPDWEQLLKKRRIDYCGDEVGSPEQLTWRQIEPGLPRAGLAGSLNPEEFAEGFILDLVRDPKKVLRAPGAWEEAPRTAKVWVTSDSEWDAVCDNLISLGLLEPCDESFLDSTGQPVENGSFGVEKTREDLIQPEGLPVLRLIVNLIPANAAQICVGGDTAGLPSQLQWAFFTLLERGFAVFSQANRKCFFYVWKLRHA
jgi:hypothetical protein